MRRVVDWLIGIGLAVGLLVGTFILLRGDLFLNVLGQFGIPVMLAIGFVTLLALVGVGAFELVSDKAQRRQRALEWVGGAAIGILLLAVVLRILGGTLELLLLVWSWVVIAFVLGVGLVGAGGLRLMHRPLPLAPGAGAVLDKWHVLGGILLGSALPALVLVAVVSRTQPPDLCAPRQGTNAATPTPARAVTAQDYFKQGDAAFDRGACAEAIAAYTQALALNPNFAEAYNNRAYTYMAQHDYARALPDLDRAIALRPNYVNARMNRGYIHNEYFDLNYDLAIADFGQVVALDPAHQNGARRLLDACMNRGDIQRFALAYSYLGGDPPSVSADCKLVAATQ